MERGRDHADEAAVGAGDHGTSIVLAARGGRVDHGGVGEAVGQGRVEAGVGHGGAHQAGGVDPGVGLGGGQGHGGGEKLGMNRLVSGFGVHG